MAYVFKRLTKGEYGAYAFKAYKNWAFTEDSVGEDIQVLYGNLHATGSYKQSQTVIHPFTEHTTSISDQETIYRQTRHLYYGGNPASGTFYVENNSYNGRRIGEPFNTFGGTNDNEVRNLSNNKLTWVSIPQMIFGEGIKRKSVKLTDYVVDGTTILQDDGNGNLYDVDVYSTLNSSGGNVTASYVGNVFYEHGNIIITTGSIYEDIISGSSANFKLQIQGTQTIYEHRVECTADVGEFNFTMNDTSRKREGVSLTDDILDHVTGSAFSPYITTIGLYDDYKRLLAVGKLSSPLKNEKELSLTFRVSIDA